ncbi:MAG: hypothetical protein COY81_03625 [Candidatus Pacebacteria bacterium CG_4_10_14_0_8_um_filter_43_12]|nr:MAG: hypothetical protein COY81_03625 [Candidatus Pacebacteria bacterium CG_4_10_14_0_8_um_filter_43_12]
MVQRSDAPSSSTRRYMIPYLLWLSFATILNFLIVWLN